MLPTGSGHCRAVDWADIVLPAGSKQPCLLELRKPARSERQSLSRVVRPGILCCGGHWMVVLNLSLCNSLVFLFVCVCYVHTVLHC